MGLLYRSAIGLLLGVLWSQWDGNFYPKDYPRVRAWMESGEYMSYDGHAVFYRASTWDGERPAPFPAPTPPPGPDGELQLVLALHGFPTHCFDYEHLWTNLTRMAHTLDRGAGAAVACSDFLGFGFSDKPEDRPFTLVDQADLTAHFLGRLRAKFGGNIGVHIFAHDIGSTVAQELWARHLSAEGADSGLGAGIRLRSLFLMNSGLVPGIHRPTITQEILARYPSLAVVMNRFLFGRSFNRVFGENKVGPYEMDEIYAVSSWKRGNMALGRALQYMAERHRHKQRWVDALAQKQPNGGTERKLPALFINGPADPVSGRHLAEAVEEISAQAGQSLKVKYLKDTVGHYPQLEDPEAVMEAAREFYA